MRDAHVDTLLHESRLAADPLGDPSVVADQQSSPRGRGKLFDLASIPQISEITYPAFAIAEGTRVDETKLKVISTPGGKPTSPSSSQRRRVTGWQSAALTRNSGPVRWPVPFRNM